MGVCSLFVDEGEAIAVEASEKNKKKDKRKTEEKDEGEDGEKSTKKKKSKTVEEELTSHRRKRRGSSSLSSSPRPLRTPRFYLFSFPKTVETQARRPAGRLAELWTIH